MSGVKATLGCVAGLILALICVACYRAASGHTVRGVTEREPVINLGPHQMPNQASIKEG